MKQILLASCCIAAASASAQDVDTTRVNRLGEALIVTNRATNKTPIAFSNLGKTEIEKANKGQDIPFLLSALPNVLVTSDAGNGIGYTSIRVRGTEATRINVTANGVPMNDAESHGLFWVNMGDFASSLNDLQLQRGVGTSTNGAAAFGASLNMVTDKAALVPHAEVNLAAGSWATTKNTLKFGTGLLNNRWTFDGRMS
ncbi:MAG: TonB-dependent receptor plug domain-containing protein, partial [Bacteroidaceae bacterium]|nr:TonB-dependent receptor plug domain-containing protein [Bacteroidaceae bacterium]